MLRTIFKIGFWIALASTVSKALGLYREHLLSRIFGGIIEGKNLLDSYYIAFRLPDFVYNIILLGVGIAVLVPLYIRLSKDEKELSETFWTINFLISVFALICSVILYFLIPYLLPAIFFTHQPEIVSKAIILSQIMVASPFFFALSSLTGSYLQSKEIYVYSHLSPIIYNIGIIFGILYLYPIYGLNGLGYGVILGAFLHFLIQIPFFFKVQIPPIRTSKIGLSNMMYCIKQSLPRGLTLATNQLNLFIDSILSGFLISGSLSLYMWTQNIFYLPLGMVGISLSIPALTHFSSIYNTGNEKKLSKLLSNLIFILFSIACIFAIWVLFQKNNLIGLLFDYGQFSISSQENTKIMASALFWLALSLPFHAIAPIFIRFSHARENMFPPLFASILSVGINFVVSYYLVTKMNLGLSGLAIGFGLAGLIQTTYFLFEFKKYISLPSFENFIEISSLIVSSIAFLYLINLIQTTSIISLLLSALVLAIIFSIYLAHKKYS